MRYFSVILFACCICACQSSVEKAESSPSFQQQHPEFSDYSLEYVLSESPDDLDAALFANPATGKILVYLTYSGKKEHGAVLSSGALSISAPEGGRASASEIIQATPATTNQSFLVPFEVINDLKFYKKTGLRGDLCPSYSLELSALNTVLTFEAGQVRYNQYIKDFGTEKLTATYGVVADTAAQRSYQISRGLSSFLHVDDTEISSAGANLHFQAYQIADSLKVAVKIVNHSNYELLIQPDVFIIKSGNQLLQPSTSHLEMVQLRKGDRFIQDFVYFPNQELVEFDVLKEAVQIIADANPANLFTSDIRFRKQLNNGADQ